MDGGWSDLVFPPTPKRRVTFFNKPRAPSALLEESSRRRRLDARLDALDALSLALLAWYACEYATSCLPCPWTRLREEGIRLELVLGANAVA